MRDVIIKCDKGEVKKTLAYIEKKDSGVRWDSGDKPTGYGSVFEKCGVYLVIERDELTFIEVDEFKNSDKKGKTVVSAEKYIGKNPSIVIFRRDRNVIAKNTATGDEGIAKCSPDDEFVFKTGAAIALARLMAKAPEVITEDVKAEWKKVLGISETPTKVYTDEDRNFKVGDRVVVRNWDDMAREYGVDRLGNINKDCQFVEKMKPLCGRTATVTCVEDGFGYKKVKVDFDDKSGITSWIFTPWMFNPTDVLAPEKEKPESKFNVGDHVTLKEGLASGKKYGALTLHSGRMYEYANGKRLEVETATFNESDGMYHYRCQATDGDYFYYTEAMLDKWDESKIHEGDTVKVINTGLNYSSYVQWVGEHISDPYMAARFCFGSPSTDKKYKVIKIAEHERNGRMLAYIEECGGFYHNRCYLIEVKGLEKA